MESAMAKWSRGVIASASSIGLVAVMVSSGIVLLAHRFVNEFTHSHVLLDDNQFTWDMPVAEAEPSAMVRRQLRIDTCDGQRLCGEFWAQPRPAPTIILCHGYRVPQVHLRPVAAWSTALATMSCSSIFADMARVHRPLSVEASPKCAICKRPCRQHGSSQRRCQANWRCMAFRWEPLSAC